MNARSSEYGTQDAPGARPLRFPDPGPALRLLRKSLEAEPPGSQSWSRVLDRLGVSSVDRSRLAGRAQRNGTSFHAELIVSGLVAEADLHGAAAAVLGIVTQDHVRPVDIVVSDEDCLAILGNRSAVHPPMVRGADGVASIAVSPERIGFDGMAEAFSRMPHYRDRFRGVPHAALRRALMAKASATLMRNAVHGLGNRFPHLSARIVANAWQGVVIGAALVGFPVLTIFNPELAFAIFHAVFSFFFLACVSLRFAALGDASPLKLQTLAPYRAADLPTYSVLVALYKEADIVPELLVALSKLSWPRSKLEIKLVCEADDVETLAALRAHTLRAPIEIIEVPASEPRTKPKALSFALPTVSGEFVVLYDAEDRPHSMQLVEAWQTFRRNAGDLACLQAPLEIANGGAGFIARAFAVEYSALFKGMLPFLARSGLLLPLGGTSNHFRRSVLEEVGAWDPHNVTEDADLGVRLVRFGYRTGTITRPTLEDAPVGLPVWLRQRTRWFKGWCQTWLVHMREPGRLYRDLGPASFLIVQILFLGMVVSSLVHPLLVLWALGFAMALVTGTPLSTFQSTLLVVDVINIVCGYVSFLLLGWQTLTPRARVSFWKVVAWTPVYWMMMSAAAWRSVWQLWRDPHLWEKTPHPRSLPAQRAGGKPQANTAAKN